MAKNPLFSLYFVFPLVLLSLSQSHAQTPSPPSKICKSTPYPSYCAAVLPTTNSSSTVYDYGRFSIRKSLSEARKFSSLIDNYLRKSKSLTIFAIRALQDCKFLAQCNLDYLTTSLQIVDKTSQTLPAARADDVQTLLSAILTNTQTCIDGLQATASAWSVRNGILTPLSNDTRLYSVSLALVTKGWVPPKKRHKPSNYNPAIRKHLMRNGKLNLKMSDKNRAVYRTVNNNRRLLQADNGESQVEVSDIVVVSQDGSWNFTTINDAVKAAPNNTDGSNGYFLIYITAGVYEEYVSIPKNKKYLMMVGAGINQTIITGNHSVVDGWTTFNSPTFGIYIYIYIMSILILKL